MRYIHDGELRDRTIDPPPVFVFDEAGTPGRGRTDTALKLALQGKRKRPNPLLIGHDTVRDDE